MKDKDKRDGEQVCEGQWKEKLVSYLPGALYRIAFKFSETLKTLVY